MSQRPGFFASGGRAAWTLVGSVIAVTIASALLFQSAVSARYERDVSRMVFNDNLDLLGDIKRRMGATVDTLRQKLVDSTESADSLPYLVVSISDHRLWYKRGDQILFTTQVATGSGKVLAKGGGNKWKFETPRGRLVVQSKETEPVWVPPDWHYVEQAKKKKLGLLRLVRGQSLKLADGSVITVVGNEVVRRSAEGQEIPFDVGDGREIVANGNIIIPPFGTTQRKYTGVLGTNRLNLGDGYALHGTDQPNSIGTSVSHGCVRLRNEDIETLYQMVPVGTPVYIY
ncbi:MAG TPA: L,D-transpeptidase [Gemmatimonadaceae bacterium]|nr:L,D-transpeptidase [Gemmatimonadaceae bacterium]